MKQFQKKNSYVILLGRKFHQFLEADEFIVNRKNSMNKSDVIVIGGGASGLTAAIFAARAGADVIILDHHPVSGKKILSTGNGKCNFTNQMQGSTCYRCDDPAFVMQALEQFSEVDTVSFFRELGVLSKTKNGYYYPRTGQASTIRDALLAEADRLHVRICNEIGIRNIKKNSSGFLIQTKTGNFSSTCCIIATGGKAAPKTGSDGSGYIYALQLGHHISDPLPALVPLLSNERWLKGTAGVRCDASVSLRIDGKEIVSDLGEVQMTDYGLSGIPVFQISRYASVALAQKKKVQVTMDFLPEIPETELRKMLYGFACHQGISKSWQQILSGICNSRIAAMVCRILNLPEIPVQKLSDKTLNSQLRQIVRQLKQTHVVISGTRHFEQAQVTCGGIPVSELQSDMQSKLVPGLYFAGEIIDVDGICGGYNLQWAWTSGFIAGSSAAKSI